MAQFYTPTKLSENIRETPEGFLLCLAVPIARTGWQVYGDGETPLEVGEDGTVRVHRESKEVFRPRTMASFQGKSITIRHPEDFVAPHNWRELTKGVAQNIRKADELDEDGEEVLLADLLITELMAIGLVKNGLREVSCGYEAEYEQTGEGEGRQFNIIGNHIALVDEGRAGPAYAINDHKGKVTMKTTLLEKLTKRFGAKVIDEVMAEEKKDSKAKDESEEKESKDAASYDELVKMVKDLGEKIEGMGKSKDEGEKEEKKPAAKEEKPAKDEGEKEEKEAKDEEESEGEKSIEERLKQLEAAVAKLLEKQTGDEEEGESEESEDEESEEAEDEEGDSSLTGDTKARVEILAPGLKGSKGVDVRVKALETAYSTKDGKAVIHTFTGGKKPVFDSAEKINTLFIAASEVLKAQRGTGLEGTKNAKAFDHADGSESAAAPMTADKMNEINAAHWARK